MRKLKFIFLLTLLLPELSNGSTVFVRNGSNWYLYNTANRTQYGSGYDKIIRAINTTRFAVLKDGKWGLIDSLGNELCPAIYDRMQKSGTHSLIVIKDGVRNRYNDQNIYSSDFNTYSFYGNEIMGGKYGVIDTNGKEIIPSIYSYVYFERGVENEKTKYYCITKNVNASTGGYSTTTGQWGMTDSTGKVIVEPEFEYFFPSPNAPLKRKGEDYAKYYFANGKRLDLSQYNYTKRLDNDYILVVKGVKYGVVNLNGELIIPTLYDDISAVYKDHFYVSIGERPKYNTGFGYKTQLLGERMGVVNSSNKITIPIEFTSIWGIPDSFIYVYKGKKKGVYSLSGKKIIPAEYEDVYVIGSNTIAVKDASRWGLFDYSGKQISPFQFSLVERINENGLMRVKKNQLNKYFLADSKGRIVLPAEFDGYQDLSYNKLGFHVAKTSEGTILIKDGSRSVVFDTGKEQIIHASAVKVNNGFYFKLKSKYFWFTNKLELHACENLAVYEEGMCIQENGKWGFYDTTGKCLIKPEYDSVTLASDHLLFALNDRSWSVLNYEGKTVYKLGKGSVPAHAYRNGFAVIRSGEAENPFGKPMFKNLTIVNEQGAPISIWNKKQTQHPEILEAKPLRHGVTLIKIAVNKEEDKLVYWTFLYSSGELSEHFYDEIQY